MHTSRILKRYLALISMFGVIVACEPVDVDAADQANATTTSTEAPPLVVDQVLIAKQKIEDGTEITDDLVETVPIERKYVTTDMLLAANRGDVIGRAAEHAIPKGALLHNRDFQGAEPEAEGPALEAIILAESDAPKREVKDKAMAALLAKGNEAYFGTLTILPGAGVPQHRDPTEEYLYVLEGGGTITIDGTSTEIEVGSSVFMPANAEVSFQNGDAVTKVVQAFGGPGPASKYDAWAEVVSDETEDED